MRFELKCKPRIGAGLCLLFLACGSRSPRDPRTSYLTDPGFRRTELKASLTNPSNGYSQLRLRSYATDGGWDALPEWNPSTEPLSLSQLDKPGPLAAAAAPLPLSREAATIPRSLGETAFFRYPAQLLSPQAASLINSEEAARRYGFWIDAEHGVGGLVRTALANGRVGLAYTCATCHAAIREGHLVIGLGNDRLDIGRLNLDSSRGRVGPIPAERVASWGPGRLDVSSHDGSEPACIPDLRETRMQTHLHSDATVVQRDLVTLAIRIETGIITFHGEVIRPPRRVTLALADYLWSLADSVEGRAPRTPAERKGAAFFATACASCHVPPSFSGPPVSIAVSGTDETLGRSPDRGTGLYRIPSLHGVAARGLLLHDGALSSLPAILDPARLEAGFKGGVRPGAVPGHAFGLSLPLEDREELVAYMKTL